MGQGKGGVMSGTGKRWGHEWDREKVGSTGVSIWTKGSNCISPVPLLVGVKNFLLVRQIECLCNSSV